RLLLRRPRRAIRGDALVHAKDDGRTLGLHGLADGAHGQLERRADRLVELAETRHQRAASKERRLLDLHAVALRRRFETASRGIRRKLLRLRHDLVDCLDRGDTLADRVFYILELRGAA